jgi:NADH:ubiquinone oxidoreductase subunit 3 (subunit A)
MTVLFIFVPILVMILLVLNLLLAVHKPDTEKVTPYECGSIESTGYRGGAHSSLNVNPVHCINNPKIVNMQP